MGLSFRVDDFFGLRWNKVKRWFISRTTYYSNDHQTFVVLLADMEEDPGLTHTRHLANALEKMGGFSLVRHGQALTCNDVAKDQFQRQHDLCETAQTWLHKREADILVAGKMYKGSFQLRFFPLVDLEKADTCPGAYSVQPDFSLDADLVERLADALELTILTHVAPVVDQSGHYLVKTLAPLVPKLEHYLVSGTGIPPAQLASVRHSLALTCQTLGEQAGDNEYLVKAIRAYQSALKEWTREKMPLNWAMAQNNLGVALSILGERESNTKRLKEAVEAYQSALKEWTREKVPLDWAMTQNNLGTALQALGARESNTERLEKAIRAYKSALEERARGKVPLDWATTQNNLGNALSILGEWESNTERLEKAVRAYKSALEERTRRKVPLDWATTKNNLGNALQALGERERNTERLEESVRAYKSALEERTRKKVPMNWATTQNNLGNTLRVLGEKNSDADSMTKALQAYRRALSVFEEAGANYYIEKVQANLERAEAALKALES